MPSRLRADDDRHAAERRSATYRAIQAPAWSSLIATLPHFLSTILRPQMKAPIHLPDPPSMEDQGVREIKAADGLAVSVEDAVGHHAVQAEADWTPEEEARARRRIDFTVLPLCCLAFYSLQLDRGNIGNVLTTSFTKDIGVDTNTVNNGQTILLCMIILLEIPSNIVLQKIGARWWLPCQMLVWGIIATFQCLITSAAGYYVTRTLLGLAESGFIPGAAYYLGTFYKKEEFGVRISLLWMGNMLGKATSGLLAAGFVSIPSADSSFKAWQWLFLLEGLMSIVIGIICLLLFPYSPKRCRTLLGFRLFNERQAHILGNRIILDDPSKVNAAKAHVSLPVVLNAVADWRIWLHVISTICSVAPIQATSVYNASITKQLGYGLAKTNALSSVGPFVTIPVTLAFGYWSDRAFSRGAVTFISYAPFVILMGVYRSLVESNDDVWTRYGVYQAFIAFNQAVYCVSLAWSQVNAPTPTKRALFAALFVMSSNAGQAIGQQLFRTDDAPLYLKGLKYALILGCIAELLFLLQIYGYWLSNKRGWGAAGTLRVAHIDLPASAAYEGDRVSTKDDLSKTTGDRGSTRTGDPEVVASKRFRYLL